MLILLLGAMGVFAYFFYMAAEAQGRSGKLAATVSVITWILSVYLLTDLLLFWLFAGIVGQVILFAAFTIYNIVNKGPEHKIVK